MPATAAELQGGAQAAQQFRQRLFETLKPDETQKAKLELIFADARQKSAGLRELSDPAERRRQFERVRAEARARIAEVLTPAQKPGYEQLLAEFAERRSGSATGRVWVLESGRPKAVEVRLGLTDGASTEVLPGTLSEGAEVIVGLAAGADKRDGLPRPRLF